jgi:uncharacterized SAM-binding protein YcdF (DUF218 family)
MEILKALGASVALWIVITGSVLIGMALFVWPRTRRFAKRWLLFVTGAYLAFGLPVVANAIAKGLPRPSLPRVVRPIQTLLVLDGDNRRGRLEVTRAILKADVPSTVWILGSGWLIDQLALAGYPPGRFHHETESSNTREQVAWVQRFVVANQGTRPALVVSRLQAPRVIALVQAAGLDVAVLVSPIDDEPPVSGWRAWRPSYIALRASRDAIYEHAAYRYYQWKGWIAR